MCFPCWPWAKVYLEEEPEQKKDPGVLVWDPIARSMVRVTGVKTVSFIFHFPRVVLSLSNTLGCKETAKA
jgi:hypothetical protein